MTWQGWTILAVLLVIVPVGSGFFGEMRRNRVRRQHRVTLTPEQAQEAFYRTWRGQIQKSKGPQEFYDVEKQGL